MIINKHDIYLFVFVFIINIANAQNALFIDQSETCGMDATTIMRRLGVSWADYNNDGMMDVFVAINPNDCLFQNQGENRFSNKAVSLSLQDSLSEASTGAWGDYDGDGDLDLFVGNLSGIKMDMNSPAPDTQNRLYRNEGGVFTDVAATTGVSGLIENVTGGTTGASWADYDNDGWIDLLVCNRQFGCFLYQNQGNGAFRNVTEESDLHTGMTANGMDMPLSYEHGSWSDYDWDGDQDLFLCAGEAMTLPGKVNMTSNRLLQNQGNGTFKEVTAAVGMIHETNGARSHSAVWGDYNNDGYPDLFSGNRSSTVMNTVAPSRLYRNNKDGTFTDVSSQVGFEDEHYVFGAAWGDVNNDGFLDLYIAIHPDMRDYPDHATHPTRLPHPLYMAQGNGTFVNVNKYLEDIPETSGITDLGHQGGAAFGDSDNDGDLDLITVEAMGLGPMRFYENTCSGNGNHWIEIKLKSDSPNHDAIGAKIIVEANGQTLFREVGFTSAGWASQMPFEQHFGLGNATQVKATVIWPDGEQEIYNSLAVDQKHTLNQSSSRISNWLHYE